VHRAGEVRSLSIHAAVQASANLSADSAGLHLRHCGSCTESPQKINEYVAALPYQESFAAALATMSAELISFGQPGKISRLFRGDVDLKMHTPRGQ
jgi:hypothetical protein